MSTPPTQPVGTAHNETPETAPQAAPDASLLTRLRKGAALLGVYGLLCGGVLVLQLMIDLNGWGLSPGERVHVPPSVRQSPGGYRSFHFWHRGVHGGK